MPKKILIVDDEPELLKAVRIRLEDAGYEVITAFDGEEALTKAQENPNLIVLDIMMPKMDGFKVLRRLKLDKKTAYIPVIMLTAKGDTASMFQAEDLMAADYLTKPFSHEELLALIKKCI